MNYSLSKIPFDIHIIHGLVKFSERERILERKLKQELDLDYTLITEHENNDVNEGMIQQYFTPDIRNVMKPGPLYCTLVHLLSYKKIIKDDSPLTVIFENDVCFFKHFKERLDLVLAETHTLEKGFIISLENSTLKFPRIRDVKAGKYIYPASTGRCAGAYIIDKTAAERILFYLQDNPCDRVIDWWHNKLIKDNVIKMYWAHPPLNEQGSSNGEISSSLSFRKKSFVRAITWRLQCYYKYYLVRMFKYFY